MNTSTSLDSLQINEHGLVLLFDETIGKNLENSLALAERLQHECAPHERVLFFNTVQAPRALNASARAVNGADYKLAKQEKLIVMSSPLGELFSMGSTTIDQKREDYRVKTIIINCWEFAARDARVRERLVFRLLEWTASLDIRVIVFVQTPNDIPAAQKIQRGGLGRLAGLAEQVIDLSTPKRAEDIDEFEESDNDDLDNDNYEYDLNDEPEESHDDLDSDDLDHDDLDGEHELAYEIQGARRDHAKHSDPVCVHNDVVEYEQVIGASQGVMHPSREFALEPEYAEAA